jgi:hypothetical protein
VDPSIFFSGLDRGSVTLNYGSGFRRPTNESYLDSFKAIEKNMLSKKVLNHKISKIIAVVIKISLKFEK